MSNHLLQHFTKNQLEQFVDTIIERTVPIRYWREFIYSSLTGWTHFISREDVYGIFDCLKHVGDNSAKKLLLHEDENGFIMIQSSQRIVKLMLTHLSKESQEEVEQKWKNNAPKMSSYFAWISKSNTIEFARPCSGILRFYLSYGSNDHLNEFVSVSTTVHIIGEVEISVWSHVFENCDREETNEIMKLAMKKVDILGRDDVKKLFLREINQVPFIIKAVSWGGEVDYWLEVVPNEIREEIQQFLKDTAPEFIEKALGDPRFFFEIFKKQGYKILNTFTFFLNYSKNSQLEQFIQNITSTIAGENARSVWAELLTHKCEDQKTDDIVKMDKFMKCVADKLGPDVVKELVLHQNGEMRIIFCPRA